MRLKWLPLMILLVAFPVHMALCKPHFEFYASETEHTVVLPFERSFIFTVRFHNLGDEDLLIEFAMPRVNFPRDWYVILPTGRVLLHPGEKVDVIATFEPTNIAERKSGEINFNFTFRVHGRVYSIPIHVKYVNFKLEEIPRERIKIKVLDAETRKPISGAFVWLTVPSGLMGVRGQTGPDGTVEFTLPNTEYVRALYEKYNSRVSFDGYFLEVSASGYRESYRDGVKTGGEVEVLLSPKRFVYEYRKVAECRTNYAVWWVKAPDDYSFIVSSPGIHDHIRPPKVAPIFIFNSEGKVLAKVPIRVAESYERGDICWGLDVSRDGSFIAAGLYNGTVLLLKRSGEVITKYDTGAIVRWVKFSKDGKYLAFGPLRDIEGGADYVGVFTVPDLKLVWKGFIGDWCRTAMFSDDGSLLVAGSSNGLLTAFNMNGKRLWVGSNGGLVPFLIGMNSEGKMIVTGGKGRTLIVYDNSGRVLWKRFLDHVIIAGGVSEAGDIAVGTVGGVVYYFKPNGALIFRRTAGGVCHNGVYITRNGRYVLIGGPNPTLLDANGTVLWQLSSKRVITPTELGEPNSVNTVYLSEDAKLIVLGYNNGTVQFWRFVKAKPVEYTPEYIPQPDMRLTIALVALAILLVLYLLKRGR